MIFGPRHTTNPSHLRKFWVQKVTHKKLLNFSEKIHRYFRTILHLCPKHLRRHYPWKIRPDFDLKELEIFWFQKICIDFRKYVFNSGKKCFGHFSISSNFICSKIFRLTKILQIDQKLTFNVSRILNQGHRYVQNWKKYVIPVVSNF